MTKKELGQFYTTNHKYILQNLHIPSHTTHIIEPFCGQGDLIKFVKHNLSEKQRQVLECYDLEPLDSYVIKRDTLESPPDYNNKFVVTNPPYLARNKHSNKKFFDKYQQNDLYKCFLETLIASSPVGGILIVPLNFWCSIRTHDINLRRRFIQKYDILTINIFEEQVFDDTTQTVCSFQFALQNTENYTPETQCYVYPEKKKIKFILNKNNNYTIGGEIYNLYQNKNFKITRATSKNYQSKFRTNLVLKCLDDVNTKINLSYIEKSQPYIDITPKSSGRAFATLLIEPQLTMEEQKVLAERFNTFLVEYRSKYNSLFLTNFRGSKKMIRKRISFKLAFQIINYLLNLSNQS